MSPELQSQLGETITQVIAFIIFFLIMKKYAWGPVTKLLDDRQRQIEDGFADIEKRQADAEALHKDYEKRLRNIEQEASARIQEAVNEGRRVAAEITENAREEARKIAERTQRNMEIELSKARIELRQEIVNMTVTATERLMREQLDPAAHRKQVDRFLQDLESEN
jgi:F-type H+-transporting ATPase subunit b